MTRIADLQDRLLRLARRREDEGIYTDANLVEAASARIAELESQLAGARVKALEWRGTEGVWAKADALFGATYRITEYAGMAKPFKLETVGFVGPSGHYEWIDEAKAAAQADYERRIMSALASPPAQAGAVTGAGCVELHIVFQDDGGPANLRFVEVETIDGKSVRAGTWLERDGHTILALMVHKSDVPALTAALGAQTPPEGAVTEAQGWRDMASAPKSVGTHIRALIETEIVMEEHIPALLMGGWKRIAEADRLVGWLPTPPVNQSEGAGE